MPIPRKPGLVLSAGGARAAYQVGVLRYIGQQFPEFHPKILTGVSAGSINAAFLAQQSEFGQATEQMYQLWKGLRFDHVMKTNFKTVSTVVRSLFYDLFLSKITKKTKLKSVLDASPLAQTLASHIQFPKIAKQIEQGELEGLAIITSNYLNGAHHIFFDSTDPIEPWKRQKRLAVRTNIRIRHIMASCSIPVLFEPVPIGDAFFGDGALGFSFPFSPAIHLGATDILAIGLSCREGKKPLRAPAKTDGLSLGVVAGAVLNSIFVDSLEADFETLQRLNELKSPHFRSVPACMIRPSMDLGELAEGYIGDLPFHFRQLLNASAMRSAELGSLVSYLMFTPSYITALLELGEKDAQTHHDRLKEYFELKSNAS